jgi:hypothetical protein
VRVEGGADLGKACRRHDTGEHLLWWKDDVAASALAISQTQKNKTF